ncbi:MAG: Methyltransferase type 11 [Candidatus Daviesbacteria bacterium GW2011_GWB1_41_5]|uniref:Methyltransferase type 11 n=1 Tax=Candidatus Daviesbacteria bacterium GW2011_GWB1_41_5 TaxID=1618429 RepID=A0A0G0WML2_9BACT|nr:MAG: Methyltransferase type 11 [Candidatus Daviesbacteria bacterium GW2011_GWB1_41_5]
MRKDSSSLIKIWNQVPPDYYEKGVQNNFLQRLWHNQKISTLKKILNGKEFKTVCDAGCAGGYMTGQLAGILPKSKIFGLDVYQTAINHASKKYKKIKFICCDLHQIPIKSKFFDLVVCYETIEHVITPQKVLQGLKQITKNDGTIILAMDSGHPLFRIAWFIWERTKGSVWRNAHLHPFNPRQLETIIKKEGLKVEKKLFSNFGMEVVFILKK